MPDRTFLMCEGGNIEGRQNLVQLVSDGGFDDIFMAVHWGAGVPWASRLQAPEHYWTSIQGSNPNWLRNEVNALKATGAKVHLWFRICYRGDTGPRAGAFTGSYAFWESYDADKTNNPGWFWAGSQNFRRDMSDLIIEAFDHCDPDGIHVDYIRQFSVHRHFEAINDYSSWTGGRDLVSDYALRANPPGVNPSIERWHYIAKHNERGLRVFLETLRPKLWARNPNALLTGFGGQEYDWMIQGQDWAGWVGDGLIDAVIHDVGADPATWSKARYEAARNRLPASQRHQYWPMFDNFITPSLRLVSDTDLTAQCSIMRGYGTQAFGWYEGGHLMTTAQAQHIKTQTN